MFFKKEFLSIIEANNYISACIGINYLWRFLKCILPLVSHVNCLQDSDGLDYMQAEEAQSSCIQYFVFNSILYKHHVYYYLKWKMPSMSVLCQWWRALLSTLLLSRLLVNDVLWVLKDYNEHKLDLVYKLKSALQTGFMVVLPWQEASISYHKVEKQNSWWGGINLHFENFMLADQLQYRRVKNNPYTIIQVLSKLTSNFTS